MRAARLDLRPLRDPHATSLHVLAVLAVVYTLYAARALLVPLVFGIMIFFLLRPVVQALRRAHVPPALGAAAVLVALFLVTGVGLYALSRPAADWMARAPESIASVQRRVQPLLHRMQRLTRTADEVERIATLPGEKPPEVRMEEPGLRGALFGGLQAVAGGLVIVLALVYVLLAAGDAFLAKLVALLPGEHDRGRAAEVTREMERQISAYLVDTTLINIGLGLVVWLSFWALGMPNAALWGALAGVTNYVPYLGALVCQVVITLAAVLAFPDTFHQLLVPVVFGVLHVVSGYLVTPFVMGRRFALDATVVFLALLFWWTVWGTSGALLAVPMMAAARIVCERVEGLEGIARFLSSVEVDSAEPAA